MRWLRHAISDPWVWAQFLLLAGLLLALPRLAPRAPGVSWAGVLLLGTGISILGAAMLQLGRNLTPATTPVGNGYLVERGLYARVRHPVYLGVILSTWGAIWILAGPIRGLVAALLLLGFFHRKATAEERKLHQRYPGYAEYARRVPGLIPRPHRPRT